MKIANRSKLFWILDICVGDAIGKLFKCNTRVIDSNLNENHMLKKNKILLFKNLILENFSKKVFRLYSIVQSHVR